MGCSLPGSSVHGILQARILEWVTISFARRFSQSRDQTCVSHICRQIFYCLSHQGSQVNMICCLMNMYFLSVCCRAGLIKGTRPKKTRKAPSSDFPWRRQWHPTPALLPGKSHGRRSLVGCSPWGRCGSDTTEWLHFYFSLSCIGEANGNPLHCSCLENPRDGEAWWAAVYGVTQSRTRLKWLSSRLS